MRYFLFSLVLFIFSCSKQQSVLICGDHECINKTEAKQFFEENLSIEVQIISKGDKSNFNLVDLNVNGDEPDIKIFKGKTQKVVKKLSRKEIKLKKAELNKIKKKSRQIKKTSKKMPEKKKRDNVLDIKKEIKKIPSYNPDKGLIDICLYLEKCDIDSITNYLIKASNEKDYPDISLKE